MCVNTGNVDQSVFVGFLGAGDRTNSSQPVGTTEEPKEYRLV